jgi:hypothetical protein
MLEVALGLFAGLNFLKVLFLLLSLPGGRGTWRFAGALRSWAGRRNPLALGRSRSLGSFRVGGGLGIGGSGMRNSGQSFEVLLLEGFELIKQK